MKAAYDSNADAIEISLADVSDADLPAQSERLHKRGGAAVVKGEPISLEILYPSLGVDEPLAALVGRFGLDLEALKAAAVSSLAAPDREVTLEVGPKLLEVG